MSEVVVITGASMGIGRALARAWAKRGATLVLSSRTRASLDTLASEVRGLGANPIVVPSDMTVATDRARLIDEAIQASPSKTIDVLVNNAGRGFYSPVMKIELEGMRELFELNVFAPLHLCQLVVPHMAKRGTIVMMSSVAGIVAAPKYGAYAASKFALEALSMSLRAELAERGPRVVVIRPGPVKTPFRGNAMRAEGEVGYDAPDPKAQSAEAVAELTLKAVDRGRPIVETSGFVRVASATSRYAPAVLRRVLRRMARK